MTTPTGQPVTCAVCGRQLKQSDAWRTAGRYYCGGECVATVAAPSMRDRVRSATEPHPTTGQPERDHAALLALVGEIRSRAAEHRQFAGVPCQSEASWHADELDGWADRLAALTSPVTGEPFDFRAHLHRQREFSKNTFGPGTRTAGVVDHIRKELREIEAKPTDLSEWIDVTILALDGAWRAGYTPDQIVAALVAKQTRNEQRSWPDWRTASPNKAIEHVRAERGVPEGLCTACSTEYCAEHTPPEATAPTGEQG